MVHHASTVEVLPVVFGEGAFLPVLLMGIHIRSIRPPSTVDFQFPLAIRGQDRPVRHAAVSAGLHLSASSGFRFRRNTVANNAPPANDGLCAVNLGISGARIPTCSFDIAGDVRYQSLLGKVKNLPGTFHRQRVGTLRWCRFGVSDHRTESG